MRPTLRSPDRYERHRSGRLAVDVHAHRAAAWSDDARRTGRITGTPISAGTHDVTIFVSDGLKTVSRSFLWSVTSGATADVTPPTFTITSHASGLVVTTARQTIRGTATDSGTGGSGIRALRVNGQFAKGGTVSASKTANWSQTITLSSGSNTITVDAVDGAGNIQMQQFTLLLGGLVEQRESSGSGSSSGPLAITGLTSNLASPQSAGTWITFFTGATGGRGPYQFKWFIFDGVSWTVARDWSSETTLAWRPTKRAAYRIGIWARDATTTADVGNVAASVPFTVKTRSAPPPVTPPSAPVSSPTPASGPLAITGLTSNLASPQSAGTRITFFTAATGGRGPYQFKWFIFDGVSWTVARDWSSVTTLAWRPTTRAAYRIGIRARDATTKADVGNVAASVPFMVKGGFAPPPVTPPSAPVSSPTPTSGPLAITGLTSNLASPQSAGTWVTFFTGCDRRPRAVSVQVVHLRRRQLDDRA